MIDVSLLLRSFLCGVVGGRTSKSEKKSLFGEKSQNHTFSNTPTTSRLYETLRSLSLLFWSKNSLFRVFCLKLFLGGGGLKKNSKNRKEENFFVLELSLSLSLLQHHHHHHNRTLLLIQRKRGSKTTPQHQNNNNNNFNFNNNNSY